MATVCTVNSPAPGFFGAAIMKTSLLSVTRRAVSAAVLSALVLTNVAAAAAFDGEKTPVSAATTVTAKYTTNLTQLGREGRLRENPSFENATGRVIKMLA